MPNLMLKSGRIWKNDSYKVMLLEYSNLKQIFLCITRFNVCCCLFKKLKRLCYISSYIDLTICSCSSIKKYGGARAKKKGNAVSYGFKLFLLRYYDQILLMQPILVIRKICSMILQTENNKTWLYQKNSWWQIPTKTTLLTIFKQTKEKIALQPL